MAILRLNKVHDFPSLFLDGDSKKKDSRMKKMFVVLFSLCLVLFSGVALAEAPRTEAAVQLDLLHKLETDGFLSKKLASEATIKYVDVKQLQAPGAAITTTAAPADSVWRRYVTWLNFIKVLAVILLLIAFGGTISNLITGFWYILAQVPVLVYQLPMLVVSVYATIAPQVFWASQSVYVALFAAFSNILLVGWVLAMHPKLADALVRFFKLGLPVASVVSFWSMLYFGVLALHYDSQIFGFFTAVSFSGLLSFGLYYSTGTLYLHFNDKGLMAVVFGHLAAIALYMLLKVTGSYPVAGHVFAAGIEYYCTIALCTGLLVGSSPWTSMKESRPMMVVIFILAFAGAMTAYFFWDFTIIGSIISCFFILFVLEWIAKLGYSGGVVVGSAVLGASLYGTVLLMEKYGSFIVLSAA